MKIAINGLGRIGRSIFRVAIQRGVDVVKVNDLMDLKSFVYLMKFDTIRGECKFDIEILDNTHFKIGDKIIEYSQKAHPKEIDFSKADIVLECTGKFTNSKDCSFYNKKTIISAPASDDTKTFVLGVNHNEYMGEEIISNASCTTNCLAPIAMILDKHYTIQKGFISTIHSYTMDQKLLDAPNIRDIRRSRAAASNIIPTFTGAAKAIYKVLPSLKGKLDGRSVRVPVNNVSLLDLVVEVGKKVDIDELKNLFKEYSNSSLKGILEIDEEYKVSSDINSNPASSILALDLIQVNENLLKIFSWYDNEWGYSNRMIDMAEYIYKK